MPTNSRPERIADDVLARLEAADVAYVLTLREHVDFLDFDRRVFLTLGEANEARDGLQAEWTRDHRPAREKWGVEEIEAPTTVTALAADLRATREEMRVLREAVRRHFAAMGAWWESDAEEDAWFPIDSEMVDTEAALRALVAEEGQG